MRKLILPCLALMLAMPPVAAYAAPPKELTQMDLLHDVVWHLYRWYLDERDADKLAGKADMVFWVRELTAKLDPGDKSLFGEILIPDLDVEVQVKKADYFIPELNLKVKNDRFKIINVSRPCPQQMPDGYTAVTANYRELKDYAHGKRALSRFPKDEITAQFQSAASEAIRKYLLGREKDGLPNTIGTWERMLKQPRQVLHLAPLLEIANETWAFWENGRMLLRFSSDLDLENPAVWARGNVKIKLYNIAEQTVVSLDEVPGSNSYLTRDQVGRVLFNSLVLGRSLPLDFAAAQARQGKK